MQGEGPPAGVDTAAVGQLAAGLMERIEHEYGAGAEVGNVALVVEVNHPDEDGDAATSITCACSDRRAWVQYGLLDCAARLVDPAGP